MTSDFPPWHGYYQDSSGNRTVLALHVRPGTVTLTPAHTGNPIHLSPTQTALLIDALASALHSAQP